MTYRIRELAGSDSGDDRYESGSAKRIYGVWDSTGAYDTNAMKAAVLTTAPPSIGDKEFDGIAYQFEEDGRYWLYTVDYAYRQAESSLRWSFDSTGGSVRLTTSRATTRYPISGRTAPDYKSAIAVRNGEPEGVDVIVPALKLTSTFRWPVGEITVPVVKSLASWTGGTNNAYFYDFAAGELLFLGATGEIVPGKQTDIQYHFAASANVDDMSIGEIASIAKKGHQYLWILFESSDDSSAKKIVQRPLAAYVETLYKEINFADFGIGTGA